MTDIKIEVDPADVGLDAGRLGRIDAHLAEYVDSGRLAGWLLGVSRGGRVAHLAAGGHRDREAHLPMEPNTIFRAWSITKPVTSVAAMILVEEGVISLRDPLETFIPAFADTRVYRRGPVSRPVSEPLQDPIRIGHLLSHTSGLTYGFHRAHPVDELYREAGFEWTTPPGMDLATCCERWAEFPLLFQPGSAWNYGVSSDVLGRVIEVASGQPLDEFLRQRVLAPLGMVDTGFWVPEQDADRLAGFYLVGPDGRAVRNDHVAGTGLNRPACLSGSAGLVTTLPDYHRFTQMLLGGGELQGVRLLAPGTVDLMARNHLPGGGDLQAVGRPVFSEMPFEGMGFGLGFAVVTDPVRTRGLYSAGEFGWHSAASTIFWVDPAADLTVILMAQLMPSSAYPLHSRLRQLVNQAVVGRPRTRPEDDVVARPIRALG